MLSPVVYQILQDPSGVLWLATGDGLSRFDGNPFVHFTATDGLPHDSISALGEDAQGHLWVAASGHLPFAQRGLCRYDGTRFDHYTAADGLASDGVLGLWIDPDGVLWVGTTSGLSRYEDQRFQAITQGDGQPLEGVTSLCPDPHGRLWIGTQAGLCVKEGERVTRWDPEEGGFRDRIWRCMADRQGRVWVGGPEGVRVYDGPRWEPFPVQEGLGTSGAMPLFEDREGRIWLAAFPEGVLCWDGTGFTAFTRYDGLANNQVEGGLQDRDGSIWIATNGGGVSRYDGHPFQHVTTAEGLLADGLTFVRQDRQGHLWVGTFRGVCRYDGQAWTAVAPASHWRSAWIDWLEDRQGRVWGVTHSGEVQCREEGAWITVRPAPEHSFNTGSLAEDGLGHLWCANGEPGVLRYDGHRWTRFTPADGLVDEAVRLVWTDREGRVWLGTMHGGVSRYEASRFVTVTAGEALGYRCLLALFVDRDGALWAGTEGGGVSRYDGSEWATFTTADGLAGNRVLAIIQDATGRIWFGTQGGGVSLYDGRVFQTLSQQDGLSNDVVKDLQPDSEGGMWLATEGGLTRYRSGRRRPTVRLREVIGDQPYGPVAELTLSVSQAFVRFAFQGSSFTTRPEGMVYVYCLEGHDLDGQVTRQRQVTYAHLAQGSYTFQVKAVDRDLNYSEPIRVAVQVTPDPRLEGWQAALKQSGGGGEFVGQSAALRRVLAQLAQAAQADVTVLILGETGTGKGLAARTVHEGSRWKDGPFLPINCGAITEGLVESELFGHEKGSFTGAHARQLGKVELAAGGTLFLDEIGDLPLEVQVKLLHLLEERTFERVGGSETLTSAVRVIAATNRDLEQMVEEGRFRADLFFRLNVFSVRLPSLRDRREDIPALVDHFMTPMAAHLHKEVNGVTSAALALLKDFAWPGNVRELKNAVERAVIVCAGKQIQAEDLALGMPEPEGDAVDRMTLAQHERQYIRQVLEETGGVIKGPEGAAGILGLPESTLRGRLKKLGLERP